jgi:hypothetical protein
MYRGVLEQHLSKGVREMQNMDQNVLSEAIQLSIIQRYSANILGLRASHRKLYSCFPHTGAPNVSDATTIALIVELDKFIKIMDPAKNN